MVLLAMRNRTGNAITIVLILSLFFSYAESREIDELVEIGQSKEEIKVAIGSPDEIKIYEKQNDHIWGPEEAFRSEIPKGTKLEVWKYRRTSGHLNLYFTNDSDTLSYEAFAPEGAVYESGQ